MNEGHKKKEHEQEKTEDKRHGRAEERKADKAAITFPRPRGFYALGAVLVLLAVLVWTLFLVF